MSGADSPEAKTGQATGCMEEELCDSAGVEGGGGTSGSETGKDSDDR